MRYVIRIYPSGVVVDALLPQRVVPAIPIPQEED